MLTRLLALVGVVLVLTFYTEVLAHAPATGQDFRLFYAAASLLRHGGNPYERGQFLREEERLYHPRTAAQRASLAGNPYVQGPPLAIALMPAVGYSPTLVYAVYACVLAAVAAAGLATLALVWPTRQPDLRTFLGLISPVTFVGIMLGQPDALLLFALTLALWALYRGYVPVAGFVLAIGLIKPQIIAGPIVLLGVMAWRRERLGAYAAGLLAGALVFVAASALITGPAVVAGWVNKLAGFGRATLYAQVDISSLTTLYVGWAPHALATAISLATLIAWAGACLMLMREGELLSGTGKILGAGFLRRAGPVLDTGFLQGTGRIFDTRTVTPERWWFALALTLWLLATPYAHPHDDILLLPAVWYALDRRPYCGAARLLAVLLFAAWWLLPMTSVLGLRPPIIRGLGIIPVLLLAALLMQLRLTPVRYPRRPSAVR